MTAFKGTIVIGGGPAGAAAAIEIVRGGGHATVLEREAGPRDKVCGEFLSEGALEDLAALGVAVQALGAVPIRRARLISGRRVAEAGLPFRAAGLSRARLDAALLDCAQSFGADVRRGVRVGRFATVADVAKVEIEGGATELTGRGVILATGKSGFGGVRRPTLWRGRQQMVGLKMHFYLKAEAMAELGDAVELHLFDGGCAGLLPVESGYANLCVTLSRAAVRDAQPADALAAVIAQCPILAQRLKGACPRWDRPLAIAGVPYGYIHQRPFGVTKAAFHVGDTVAVTASFTGDGLALALAGGRLAGVMSVEGCGALDFHQRFVKRAELQVVRAMRLQALVDCRLLHRPTVVAMRLVPSAMRLIAAATRLRVENADLAYRADHPRALGPASEPDGPGRRVALPERTPTSL